MWSVTVDELPGVVTNVHNFRLVEPWIRDAIAIAIETSPRAFDVTLDVAPNIQPTLE
jgi:hypothetical protein